MPRRLQEKARMQRKQPLRFIVKSQQHQMAFQREIPVKDDQEIEVMIGGIESHGNETERIRKYPVLVLKSATCEKLRAKIACGNREFALAGK